MRSEQFAAAAAAIYDIPPRQGETALDAEQRGGGSGGCDAQKQGWWRRGLGKQRSNTRTRGSGAAQGVRRPGHRRGCPSLRGWHILLLPPVWSGSHLSPRHDLATRARLCFISSARDFSPVRTPFQWPLLISDPEDALRQPQGRGKVVFGKEGWRHSWKPGSGGRSRASRQPHSMQETRSQGKGEVPAGKTYLGNFISRCWRRREAGVTSSPGSTRRRGRRGGPGHSRPRDRYGRYASPALGPIQTRQRRRAGAGARPLPVPANPLARPPCLSPPSARSPREAPAEFEASPWRRSPGPGPAARRGGRGAAAAGGARGPRPPARAAREQRVLPTPPCPPRTWGARPRPPPRPPPRPIGPAGPRPRPSGQWGRRSALANERDGDWAGAFGARSGRVNPAAGGGGSRAGAPSGAGGGSGGSGGGAEPGRRGGGWVSEWVSERAGGRATPRGLEAAPAPGAAIYTRVLCHGGGEEGRGRQGGREGGEDAGGGSRGTAAPSVPFPRGAGGRTRALPAGDSWRGRHGVWSALCLSWLRPARPAAPVPARRGADPGWGRARRHRSGGRRAGGERESGARAGDSLPFPSFPSRPLCSAPAGGTRLPARAGQPCERGKSVCPPWAAPLAARPAPPGRLGQLRPGSRKPGRAPGPPARTPGRRRWAGGSRPRFGALQARGGSSAGARGKTQSGGRSRELPKRGEHRVIPTFQSAARKFINSWKFWGFGVNIAKHGDTERCLKRGCPGRCEGGGTGLSRPWATNVWLDKEIGVLWHHADVFYITGSSWWYKNCYSYTKEKQCVHRCAAGMGLQTCTLLERLISNLQSTTLVLLEQVFCVLEKSFFAFLKLGVQILVLSD